MNAATISSDKIKEKDKFKLVESLLDTDVILPLRLDDKDPFWDKFQLLEKKKPETLDSEALKIKKIELLNDLQSNIKNFKVDENYRSFELVCLPGSDLKNFRENHESFEINIWEIYIKLLNLNLISLKMENNKFLDSYLYIWRKNVLKDQWKAVKEITQTLILDANTKNINFHIVTFKARYKMNVYYLQNDPLICLENCNFDFYTFREIYKDLKKSLGNNFVKYKEKNKMEQNEGILKTHPSENQKDGDRDTSSLFWKIITSNIFIILVMIGILIIVYVSITYSHTHTVLWPHL